jgi:hypothetical protein
MESTSLALPLIFSVIAFLSIWGLVTSLLRSMAGMTRTLDVSPGRLLRESSLGSGSVNGVRMRNCLRFEEYQDGWVARLPWILGDGKLWLPKGETEVQPISEARGLFAPRHREIVYGRHRVLLYGGLVDFVG